MSSSSIQYKFRSCVEFESLSIEDLSISVCELRAEITRIKNLDLSQGFDLRFSDALTGQEYKEDCNQIPSGSSVIVRRVPAPPRPSTMIGTEKLDSCNIRERALRGMDVVAEEKNLQMLVELKYGEDIKLKRIGTEKLDNIRERALRGMDVVATENNRQMLTELKCGEDIKLKRIEDVHPLALQNHLSSGLKCSLCKSYFKEAVLIRCCQHSFCQKCIHQTLIQKGACPKCNSKCKVDNLVPNLTLSRLVKQFLESTIRWSDDCKPLHTDVSDDESANRPNEQASNIPKRQRELERPVSDSATPVSDSATQTGSNYIMRDYGGDNMHLPIWRHNKGDQTCNMCGSPDHLIRYCPLAPNPLPIPPTGNPMFPGAMPGYGSPFWNGISFAAPAMRPYSNNMYGNFGMMHLNPAMFPLASPYAVPPYMLSMYGDGQQGPSGVMRSVGPQHRADSKYSAHPSEFQELRNSEKRQRMSNESLRRGGPVVRQVKYPSRAQPKELRRSPTNMNKNWG